MRRPWQVGPLLVGGFLAASAAAFAASAITLAAHQGGEFPDVPSTHPEAWAIEELRQEYAVSGFEDGTYRPDELATRAGVVKLGIQASGSVRYILAEGEVPSYKDVPPTDPNSGFIERAVRLGVLTPDGPDALFRPQASATRAEALKLILSCFGITPPGVSGSPFTDVKPDSWEAPYATFAAEAELLRLSGGVFEPTRPIRRGEVARIAATILRAQTDAARPVLPIGVAVALTVGWLACGVPLVARSLRSLQGPARVVAAVGAVVAGPVGAVGATVERIVSNARDVGGTPPAERPTRRRRIAHHALTAARDWLDASLVELVGLTAVGAYVAVLLAVINTARATAALRESVTPLLHG